MGNDKNMLSEEYLRKFRHRAGYTINESAKYRSLVSDTEEFDDIPAITNEAGEQQDAEKPEGAVPPEPSNDVPQGEVPATNDAPDNAVAPEAEPAIDTPVPAFDAEGNPPANPNEPNPESSENQVDVIQNEIIKHNIEAMKGIQMQLDGLNSTIQGLNSKIDTLNADVEEVREPTDAEKLLNKSEVSYPYYFNLNDLWQDNWFEQKRGESKNNGIKELPDGTYVADFDDLPQQSKGDIENSFNEIV